MDVAQIAEVAFTSPDRVRAVLHNFNEDGPPPVRDPHRHRLRQLQPRPFNQDGHTRVGDSAATNNVELTHVPTNASLINCIEAQFEGFATSPWTAPTTGHTTGRTR
jgi:hypothetical protein